MKKHYITLIVIISSLLQIHNSYSQDAHFSQFYSTPIYLNPSLAGTSGNLRASAAYRQQGTQAHGFETYLFSLDASIGEQSGVGAILIRDSQMDGVLTSTFISTSAAHSIKINKSSRIGLGVQVGIYQKMLDWSRLTFEDQLDQRNGVVTNTQERFGQNKVSVADITVGASYISDIVFGGIKISHLNQPTENFAIESETIIPIKATLHAGAMFQLINSRRQQYVLSPNVIYERQGRFQYLHVGFYYGNEVWTAGLWHRVNDAIIASVGMNISSLRVGYSYDVAISQHKNEVSNNAHEVTLGYQFNIGRKFKVKNQYKGKCPRFQKQLF